MDKNIAKKNIKKTVGLAKTSAKKVVDKIITNGDARLRKISKDVKLADITSPKFKSMLADMSASLDSQSDGVAIAAPQIGVNLRVFMVSGKVFDDEENPPKNPTPNQVYINPEIIKASKKMVLKEGEGCLSVRWLYGKVKRHTNVTIKYHDHTGKLHVRGAGGLLAHIFQHEIDHLNGVLFIDKAIDVEEILPEDHNHDAK
jgi:peptide deformylase